MALYTKESIERVRDGADMAEIVSGRVELRRAGRDRMTGRCPFHDERTPSFGISPSEKVFHCFGCGAGGDLFRFVQDTEGVDFKGAVELVADRYGIELEREAEDPRAAQRRRAFERLHELLERTAAFYVRRLWETDEAAGAREYLLGRGLEEATLREFRVGYAPSAWDTVLMACQRSGYTARELYDAGLAQRPRDGGRLYDRFRSQIMFPLCDPRGRVLGFAGRRMGESRGPKYINSPEGDLFHKGRMVFAADLARAHAAKAGEVVVAEGYTDVLMLHQAGLRNAVATMGTALTEEQVGELARLAPIVLLALDSDSAGQEAMVRAARAAAGKRVDLRVVPMPQGLDPADLVARDGAAAMRRAVEAAVPFVRFRVERALATGDLTSAEGKDRVLADLRPVLSPVAPSVLREELLRLIADRIDVPADTVARLLTRGAGGGGPGSAPAPGANGAQRDDAPPRPTLNPRERSERAFLAYCIALPGPGREALADLDLEHELAFPGPRRAAEHLRDHLDRPTSGVPEDDEELSRLLAELAVRAEALEATPAGLEAQRLQLALARASRDLAAARAAGGSVARLAHHRDQLKVRFDVAVQRMADESPDR
ncbi:MAG: DNA primase [Solirubrobacteraceae bacterium MAG38_C4-C5]|nr:DNA primase [Candidatus Siliceabacter maunaloa]